MKHLIILLIFVFLAIFHISCHKTETPVDIGIELNIELNEPLYEFTHIEVVYNWLFIDPLIELSPDIKVFVHFWSINQNRMLFQDDHDLSISAGSWAEMDRLSYSRKIFIPYIIPHIDEDFKGKEDVRISIGLYNSTGDLNVLLHSGIYTFLALPYVYPKIVFGDGWHGLEIDYKYRWTAGRALLIVENIGIEMELHIKGSVMKEVIPEQSISISIDDILLDEFIPESNDFYRVVLIPDTLLGDISEMNIYIAVNNLFVPSEIGINEDDHRELGIMVRSVHFCASNLSSLSKVKASHMIKEIN